LAEFVICPPIVVVPSPVALLAPEQLSLMKFVKTVFRNGRKNLRRASD
jgi:hypothetical protein